MNVWKWVTSESYRRQVQRRRSIDVKGATRRKLHPWGSRYLIGRCAYRYACAGEDLKIGALVEADLAGRIASQLDELLIELLVTKARGHMTLEPWQTNLLYGNVKAATDVDQWGANVLGWPEVNVKKGRYFWLREPPLGAEFKKEEGRG